MTVRFAFAQASPLRGPKPAGSPLVLWQATVPGVDPLTVREGDPEPDHADADGQAVVVVYETKQTHVFRLTLFFGERWLTALGHRVPRD